MSSYSHLTASERVLIDRLRFRGHRSIRQIADMIGRSPSTVSRELRRNLWNPSNENESYRPYRPARLKTGAWTGGPYYCASAAQRLAGKRRERCVRRRRMSYDRLVAWVMDALRRGWSPATMAGRLRLEYPDDPLMRAGHETLYSWVYRQAADGTRDLRAYLPRGHRRRRARKGRRGRRIPIPARVSIHERPAAVQSRREFGHWESDTVIGGGVTRRCINTQVERKTRFLVATLVDSKEAAATAAVEARVFGALPPAARISRTWDNGSESALHLLVDESTGMLTYYADPYSSYQRGSNANRNGMIRRYLPKGTSLDDMAQDELDETARRINGTPLKVLGWLTPAEAWDEQMERLAAQDTPVPGHPVQSTPTHNTRQCCTSN